MDEEEKEEGEPDFEPIPQNSEEKGKQDVNLEDAFSNLFKTSASGSGEEELLRIASTYSRQISMRQIKALLWLEWQANTRMPEAQATSTKRFIDRWLEFVQFNNSAAFVMRALESISLRKFIGENAFKVNIEK